jgi:hypothetical protein
MGPTIACLRMRRRCDWCSAVLEQDEAAAPAMVIHSICPRCIAKIDAQIRAAAQIDLTLPCPSCPQSAILYRVVSIGEHRTLYVRCNGCSLSWMVEA